ncbi:MAG: 5-oxoprolinase subunit PxpB [Bacillota bacterium]|nr:MAG: 5-oxoprolinase subunit PxpB [Bacillota bacterium]
MPDGAAGSGPAGSLAPVCRPAGDRHLVLELGDAILPEVNERVRETERVLLATAPPGLRETTPAYASLLVRYNPLATDHDTLARICLEAARLSLAGKEAGVDAAGMGEVTAGAAGEIHVPVVYGGEWGPDLEDVCRYTHLSRDDVVRRHTSGRYVVHMIGFAPGFAYLGGMDPSLATPRLDVPRPNVPAGSVGIAGLQTGVYPAPLPGGWRIVGRTPLCLWRPEAMPPALLEPGRRVRFVNAGAGREGWSRAVSMAQRIEEMVWSGRSGEGRSEGVAGLRGTTVHPGEGSESGDSEAEPVARVLTAGPLDTIQDGGRWGHARWGLPESGALDWPSLAAANVAVGNDPAAAGVEVTYGGLSLEFVRPVGIALSPGAKAELGCSGLPCGERILLRKGDTVTFRAGAFPRAYLAIEGGVAAPVVLGSRSTYVPARVGGHQGRGLKPGDVLRASPPRPLATWSSDPWVGRGPGQFPRESTGREVTAASPPPGDDILIEIRAIRGPQDRLFDAAALGRFFGSEWRVSGRSDRRACLLEGETIPAPPASGVSDGTPAGSVQVLPSGAPLVLLADHQTTGGYPKIATVVGPDLPLLGRARPGTRMRFVEVGIREARRIWLDMPREVARRWPGNVPRGESEGTERESTASRRVLSLSVGGRRHLVSVDHPQ